MKHFLFIAFIVLLPLFSIQCQNTECQFINNEEKIYTHYNQKNSSCASSTVLGSGRACKIKDFEATYNYNSLSNKYVPIVFHVFYNNTNPTHVADFNDIEERIYTELNNVNLEFAGLKHLNNPINSANPPSSFQNSMYHTAIENSPDTKIRFVLPNKDENGECSTGINIYSLNNEEYDSLYHWYSNAHNNDIQIISEYHYSALGIAGGSFVGGLLFSRYIWYRSQYINVIILPKDEINAGGAISTSTSSRVIMMSNQRIGIEAEYGYTSTLTHELGHYLDLKHSFVNILSPSYQFCENYLPNLTGLEVCIDANNCASEYAPDNALVFGNYVRDLPSNVDAGLCVDDILPLLYDDNALLYGIDYPVLEYYTDLTIIANCPNPLAMTKFYYNSDFNFMSYNACRHQFTPHQTIRMHSVLEDFSYNDNNDLHKKFDNANLWSQSNLENIGILKGPDDNTPLEITNAVAYNCPITLIGEVIIKTGGSLTLNDALMYSDNACLTVEPGGQLIMPNGPQTSNTPYLTWVNNNCSTVPLQFQMRALLEGFYDSSLGEMETELQNSNILPLVQPFNADPWYYNGAEAVVGHSTNTSDWVLLRLFDNSGTVVEEQAALINKFGYVTTVSGDPILQFNAAIAGQTYRISIHHKGHLAAIADVTNGGFVDFTRPDVAQGFQQTKDINGIEFLYGGDYDGNGIINNLDYNLWALNSAALNQYLTYDGDGNAIVNNLDYNLWGLNKSKVGELDVHY